MTMRGHVLLSSTSTPSLLLLESSPLLDHRQFFRFSSHFVCVLHRVLKDVETANVHDVWQTHRRSCHCRKIHQPSSIPPTSIPTGRPASYCYPNPANDLVGKQFRCTSKKYLHKLDLHIIQREIKPVSSQQDITFAVAAKLSDLRPLQLLVASIHKHYPTSSIVVYDMTVRSNSKIKSQRLHHGLRNVVNVVIRDPQLDFYPLHVTTHPDAFSAILLADAVVHFGRVVWLSRPTLILKSPQLKQDIFSRACPHGFANCKQPNHHIMLLLDQLPLDKPKKLGFLPYFPTISGVNNRQEYRNATAIYLERHRDTYETVRWLMLCAVSAKCWNCKNTGNMDMGCLPYVLPHLLLHQTGNNREFQLSVADTFRHQPTPPSECGVWCVFFSFVGIIIAFCFLVSIACLIALCVF